MKYPKPMVYPEPANDTNLLEVHLEITRIIREERIFRNHYDRRHSVIMIQLKIIYCGRIIEDTQVVDHSYLSLCNRLYKICYLALNKLNIYENKDSYNISLPPSRVELMRSILKNISNQLAKTYNGESDQRDRILNILEPPKEIMSFISYDSNEIAKCLYNSGYKYTLIVKSFVKDNDDPLVETCAILFIKKDKGIKCVATKFNNFDGTIKSIGAIFFYSLGNHRSLSKYDWLYDGIVRNDYRDDPLYEYICKTIQANKNIDPGDGVGAVIHYDGIYFILRHTDHDFVFTDIVEPSIELTEPIKLLDSKTEKINKNKFIKRLASKLSEIPSYQQHYLIMVNEIVDAFKKYL